MVLSFLKKLKIELSYDPAIPFMGTYPIELELVCQWDIFTTMFMFPLFTIAKKCSQPKHPSTDKERKHEHIVQ
jgi:hypothetical protein